MERRKQEWSRKKKWKEGSERAGRKEGRKGERNEGRKKVGKIEVDGRKEARRVG